MTVLEVKFGADRARFNGLELDTSCFASAEDADRYRARFFSFTGGMIERWVPPVVRSAHPGHPSPDFWGLGAETGAFAVGERAFADVSSFLVIAGQLLDLPFEGRSLTICNILRCVDCVEEDLSEWKLGPSGERLYATRPFFVAGEVGESSLFKVPQHDTAIYTWEYARDTESEFKACVEANRLTGLEFVPVWSEDEGIIPERSSGES